MEYDFGRKEGEHSCRRGLSAVSVFAVAGSRDFDGAVVLEIEEHAIVSAPQAETSERRLELFHLASAAGQ